MTPPSPDGSSDGVTSQPTDVLIDPITAGEDLEEGHETMSYEERIESVRAFAGRVMDTFIESIGSLQHASHFELNALSRAYFQMNKISEGFDTLKVILDRKEIPDPHDINVALSALSAHDPREATQMIRRMVDLGLTPDSVTFGTVIHHAVLHNDSALVTILIKLAKRVGVEHLDYKTLGTLIRGAVTEFGEDDPEAQLRTAQELMDALLNAGFVPSPAMGMDCILAALHASDPVAAFKFWKLIVKDKVDWKDFKQVVYRARIARAIRRYYKEKSLDPDKSRAMLSELGVDPSLERRYRQNAAATQA
ncbi:hypothetical protein EW026_g2938 [Hermanssonia centrifuga]|uniref:Uncharacterized protein n=1 Tax=Hermanssonia centrifuga TaxID=98765 RepID=A0A4S4KRB1_9APHY|nr:hypothetical protein EW026_g2938 [Hermanssonia centrifuga]